MPDASGSIQQIAMESWPDRCPICHRSIDAIYRMGSFALPRKPQAIFECPSAQCRQLFIAHYVETGHNTSTYRVQETSPVKYMAQPHPEQITKTSADFVTIYDQAMQAESAKLDQLVGMGLRKALEFLIKDFLVKEHAEEADEIRRMLLGRCIEKYVDDGKLKMAAQRAAWLGNDETHYERRWDTKDVTDLKRLVHLTENWIDSALVLRQYEDEMPASSKNTP